MTLGLSKTDVAALGVVCLTAICVTALLKGINTTVVGVVCSTVGVIVGYMFGVRKG